jgi:prepilin-type processing-associated H-X9-DG protein
MLQQEKASKIRPVEAFVLVFLCLFALAVVLPATQMSQFEAYRIECGANLSQIGRAMFMYADDYDDELPRSGGESTVWAPTIPNWRANNRFFAYGLSADGDGGQASISSCFYLLVKYFEATPGTFVCPGDVGTTEFKLTDVDAGDKELIDLWDFGPEARERCSYAYQGPFGFYALNMSDDPGLAVAADRNPWIDSPAAFAKQHPGFFYPDGSREAVKYANARAHDEEGQNVLFLDGHVAFEDRSFCGVRDDNIYTYWDGGDMRIGSPPTIGSRSQSSIDSLLVHDPFTPVSTTITKDPVAIESNNLEQTSFVATLDCNLPKNQNIIWCSTFQMDWDIIKRDIIGEPFQVRGAENLSNSLNAAEFSSENLEAESYIVAAGLLWDVKIEQILEEIILRFPFEPPPNLSVWGGSSKDIIAFSFLLTDIKFEYPFYINNDEFEFQDSNGTITEVKSFCTRPDSDSSDMIREQVDVLYYKHNDLTGETEFAVDLCTFSNPYQVILACVPRRETPGEILAFTERKIFEFIQDPNYEQLRELRPASDSYPADSLIVPDVLYILTHRFVELEGRVPSDLQYWQWYEITLAMQMIDFALNKTGSVLESNEDIILPPAESALEQRRFHFNRPFLVYIKKRGPDYSPFFVMWVDNAELMQEFVPEN